jgi:hypothetical protein
LARCYSQPAATERCISPKTVILLHRRRFVRDMRTKCESVRFRGKTGSRRLAVKVTRLTQS